MGSDRERLPSLGEGYELPATSATTTTAAPATTTTATPTAATTTTAAALLFRLIDADGPAVELGAIHLGHRAARGLLVGESHEAEAARAARVAIRDHFRLGDVTKARETVTQPVIGRVEAESA